MLFAFAAVQGETSLTVVFLDVSTPTESTACSTSGSSSNRSTSSWESVAHHKGVQQLQSWPAALLPQALPKAHIITLSCTLSAAELRSSKQRGSKVAADLVQAVQGTWQQQLGQSQLESCAAQQLVLVGHGFGGHLLKVRLAWLSALHNAIYSCRSKCSACSRLQVARHGWVTQLGKLCSGLPIIAPPVLSPAKPVFASASPFENAVQEVCLQLQQLAANPSLPACQRQQYACTLASIRGLVFYSTFHQPLPRLTLPEYEYVLPDMASVCQRFRVQCGQYGWQTLGVGAAVQVCGTRFLMFSGAEHHAAVYTAAVYTGSIKPRAV